MASEAEIEAAAAAIANGKLYDEVMDDAQAALKAAEGVRSVAHEHVP